MSAKPAFARNITKSAAARNDAHAVEHPSINNQTVEQALRDSENRAHNDIAMSSHRKGGHVEHENIRVPDSEGPVADKTPREKRESFALKQSIIQQLTPTMQKFTLQGKTAVITG